MKAMIAQLFFFVTRFTGWWVHFYFRVNFGSWRVHDSPCPVSHGLAKSSATQKVKCTPGCFTRANIEDLAVAVDPGSYSFTQIGKNMDKNGVLSYLGGE